MLPKLTGALFALMLGGLAAFAQETKMLHTFDRLPFVPDGAPTVTYGNNNWLPNTDANPPATPRPNRITYEGLELGDNANTNGAFTLTFPAPLDLSRYERIEITAAALPLNALNRFNLELASGSGAGLRRTVHYAGTAPLTRHGDRLGFAFDAPNRWHRDASPVDYSAVASIRVSGDWAQNPGAARLIIRELVAVTDTLFSPQKFPAARIAGTNQWQGYTLAGGVLTLPATATGNNGGLSIRYYNPELNLDDDRDLVPFETFTIEATPLPDNASDLGIKLTSVGGGWATWRISRLNQTRTFDLRRPDQSTTAIPFDPYRLSNVYIYGYENTNVAARWQLGAIRLECPTFTYRRGVNISHWMAQLGTTFTYGNEARFSPSLATHIAELARNTSPAQNAFDHIRIPVDYQEWGTLAATTFTLNETKVARFATAINWARDRGLGVILDLHSLPGLAMGEDVAHPLFVGSPATANTPAKSAAAYQAEAAAVWDAVAKRFANEGPWLRFELMNEPRQSRRLQSGAISYEPEHSRNIAEVQERLRRTIRASNPNRVIYVTTNNLGSMFQFFGAQKTQPGYTGWGTFASEYVAAPYYGWDKHLAYTIHYYEPYALTHYKLPETPANPHLNRAALDAALSETGSVHTQFNKLREDLTLLADPLDPSATKHYLREYREIHIGEFGTTKHAGYAHGWSYNSTNPDRFVGFSDVREHFMYRVRKKAEEHGFGWCAWDYYDSDYSIFNPDGPDPDTLPDVLPAANALLRP